MCKLHGFTASELRGYIKARGTRGKAQQTTEVKRKRDPNTPKRKYTRRVKPAV